MSAAMSGGAGAGSSNGDPTDVRGFPRPLSYPAGTNGRDTSIPALERAVAPEIAMRALGLGLLLALASPPAAVAAFDAPPDRYGGLVDPVLAMVGSELRTRAKGCAGTPPVCRFTAGMVGIEVRGVSRGTAGITIAASFPRGDETAAATLLEDVLLLLGSTMVAYDPILAASRRVEIIDQLGDAAIQVGEAHVDSAQVHYRLTFDNVDGGLEIGIGPLPSAHR